LNRKRQSAQEVREVRSVPTEKGVNGVGLNGADVKTQKLGGGGTNSTARLEKGGGTSQRKLILAINQKKSTPPEQEMGGGENIENNRCFTPVKGMRTYGGECRRKKKRSWSTPTRKEEINFDR